MNGKAGEGLAPGVQWLKECFEELGGIVGVAIPLHMVFLDIVEDVEERLDALEVLLQTSLNALLHLLLGMIGIEDHGDGIKCVFRSTLIRLRLGLHKPWLHVHARHDVSDPLVFSEEQKSSIIRSKQNSRLEGTHRTCSHKRLEGLSDLVKSTLSYFSLIHRSKNTGWTVEAFLSASDGSKSQMWRSISSLIVSVIANVMQWRVALGGVEAKCGGGRQALLHWSCASEPI